MEIEYAYSFTENVFYTGLGMLRFYFWLIPFGLLYSLSLIHISEPTRPY